MMRGMNDSCIELIYLDLPFNSTPLMGLSSVVKEKKKPLEMCGLFKTSTWRCGNRQKTKTRLYTVVWIPFGRYTKSLMSYLIYMTVRLMEIERTLKVTDFIYLHYGPTASYHLKHLMDAIFKHNKFRDEIVWQ